MWNIRQGSNLLKTLRNVHTKFQNNPPRPEGQLGVGSSFGSSQMNEYGIGGFAQTADRFGGNNEDQAGQYLGISAKQFMPSIQSFKCCIVHFYHQDVQHCSVIDRHLENLAP